MDERVTTTIRLGGVDRPIGLPKIVESSYTLDLDSGDRVAGDAVVHVGREPWMLLAFVVEDVFDSEGRRREPDGLTADELSRLDWAALQAETVLSHLHNNWPPVDGADLEELLYDPERSAIPDLRRRAYTRTNEVDLKRVAELYASDPDKPRKAVMDGLHVSKSTASRWIALARDEGEIK